MVDKDNVPKVAGTEEDKADVKGNSMTWTMKICVCYALITSVVFMVCIAAGGVGPRREPINESDTWHAAIAVLLVLSLAVTEICVVAGGASNTYILNTVCSSDDRMEKITMPGAYDAWWTLLEYMAKIMCGLYMYLFSGGVVHTDTLAVNGARPVYMARFVQWSLAVPILMLITNSACIDSQKKLLQRSSTNLWASFTFVWAAWLMEVTPYYGVRWLMMFMSLSGAVVSALDQFYVFKENATTRFYRMKHGLLIYSKALDILYAVVFLLGRFGVITSGSEHIFYAYADATVKVFHGAFLAMLRSREGASDICHWCMATMAARNDLKDLLYQARIPALSIDLEGRVTQWNDSACQLTGFQAADVQGKILLDLCASECKEELSKRLEGKLKHFQLGSTSSDDDCALVEMSLVTSTTESQNQPAVRRLAMSLAPKRNSAGQLEGITAIGQDMSEIVDLKMVQERKDALLAMLGHEIRSPLHGIMGLTSALMESPASKPMHRQLGMVKGCSARLLDLVNNIMDLAQSEKKKLAGVPSSKPTTVVDLPSIVEEAIVMIGNSVDKTNKPLLKPSVRLENKLVGTKVPVVRGDAYKCAQLIYNLITNAAKFTDRGLISISCRHLVQDNLLEIDVADTGKGISEAGQKRIFQPFEQEASGDCRSFQGIGLGLAVCKEIADLHEGTIRVKSVVGQGSTFTLSLPCERDFICVDAPESTCSDNSQREEAGDDKVHQAGSSPPELLTSEDTSRRDPNRKPFILSVDDDEVNQEVIKNTLGDICEVACTMCGSETLTFFDSLVKAKRSFPELVLLDIQMPGMSGFEVCDKLRAQYGSPESLPVTMLSAKAPSEAAAIQSFDVGCTDFISKPFNPQILRRKVRAALKMKQSGTRLAGANVLSSEVCKAMKDHGEELMKAKNRASALEAELNSVNKIVVESNDRVKGLEAEIASIQSALESRNEELNSALQERDDLQRNQTSILAKLDQAPSQAEALQRSRHADDSPAARRGMLNNVRNTHEPMDEYGASVIVRLLVARLRICGRSAKQCQRLLTSSMLAALPPQRLPEVATLTEHELLHARLQLKKLCGAAKVTVSELAMLEHVTSNIGAITGACDDNDEPVFDAVSSSSVQSHSLGAFRSDT
eukprot:TRINITY_DN11801_c0_g10_i1.p1 TRINITY_DN11801_c0_g10~~TRINITY_DN11801_c0_g10_i1.p1  ORF type:complete len:1130 (-),score=179.91 TRINITY_DN11801_c0_g10_i1:304-3693(-)